MRLLALPFLVIALLTLAACEAPEPRVDAPGGVDTPGVVTDPADTEVAPPPTADATADALELNLTQFTPRAARENIDGWVERIEGVQFQRRDDILDALRQLRSEVQREPVDAGRIAELLGDLGNWTSAAGSDADHPGVQRLGQVLSNASERIREGVVAPPLPTDGIQGRPPAEQPTPTPEQQVPAPQPRN